MTWCVLEGQDKTTKVSTCSLVHQLIPGLTLILACCQLKVKNDTHTQKYYLCSSFLFLDGSIELSTSTEMDSITSDKKKMKGDNAQTYFDQKISIPRDTENNDVSCLFCDNNLIL